MLYFSQPASQLTKYGPFLSIDDFLTADECQKVIAQMPEIGMDDAKVHELGVKNDSIRSAKVCALLADPKNDWLFQKIEQAVIHCNREVYQFNILGFGEMIQLVRYDKGDFYDWHQDFSNLHHSNRKLSLSIQLTDGASYEGGDLEFFKNGKAPKELGTMIMFPSFMHHKVHPITQGTRRALVGWVSGQPYS